MNKERLLQLADHLENGKLGHEKFDFNSWNTEWDQTKECMSSAPNKCGTHGCAIGECPIVWPDEWEFNHVGVPMLKNKSEQHPYSSTMICAKAFFRLLPEEADALFVPSTAYYDSSAYGFRNANLEVLDAEATKEQVASNIRKFVAWKERQL